MKNLRYCYTLVSDGGIVGMTCCDFVIYTNKGINVERILYNEYYWKNTPAIYKTGIRQMDDQVRLADTGI